MTYLSGFDIFSWLESITQGTVLQTEKCTGNLKVLWYYFDAEATSEEDFYICTGVALKKRCIQFKEQDPLGRIKFVI